MGIYTTKNGRRIVYRDPQGRVTQKKLGEVPYAHLCCLSKKGIEEYYNACIDELLEVVVQ